MLAPAANRAVVPRLSPRMREQVREHAIMQGDDGVLEPMEGGSWGLCCWEHWVGATDYRYCHLPRSVKEEPRNLLTNSPSYKYSPMRTLTHTLLIPLYFACTSITASDYSIWYRKTKIF